MIKSIICDLLGIERPLFQGGMAWIADAKLAAAVSNAGGLGLISSINFGTEAVREEIRKCKTLTDKPFGVNIMLQAPNAGEVADMIIEEGVKIVTTGAGSPAAYMENGRQPESRSFQSWRPWPTPLRCRSSERQPSWPKAPNPEDI